MSGSGFGASSTRPIGGPPGPAAPSLHADAVDDGWLDIGRAAKASDLSAKMVRHYEAIGLLGQIQRTAAGYRIYGPTDVHRLRFIRRARALGFSMEEIRALLALWADKGRPSREVKRLAQAHVTELRQRIDEMQSMVATLEDLAERCHGDHRPDCPILQDLAGSGRRGPGATKRRSKTARTPGANEKAPHGGAFENTE